MSGARGSAPNKKPTVAFTRFGTASIGACAAADSS